MVRLHSSFSLKSADFVLVDFKASSLDWGRPELKPEIFSMMSLSHVYNVTRVILEKKKNVKSSRAEDLSSSTCVEG